MDNKYLRKDNESDVEYGLRLISIKKENKPDDLEWSDIVELIGLDLNKDSLRKSQDTPLGGYAVYKYFKDKQLNSVAEDDILQQIKQEKRELQQERYKLQTEKSENNKWIRENARVDLYIEKMVQAIDDLEPLQNPFRHRHDINVGLDNKDSILAIGDPHFGKEVLIKGLKGEILNEYNEEIFQARMWTLLHEVRNIINKEKLLHTNIFLLGDCIDGILRMSQLQSLQYGIVESTMRFAEFMANWINELSQYTNINLYAVLGNHSQIRPLGSKNGDFPNENMEIIINWYLKSRIKDNPNVKIHDNENGFIFTNIQGINVMASHGEENNLEQAVKDYITLYGERIDLFLAAHLHSTFEKSVGIGTYGDIEIQRIPSICGIDDFSMKLRRAARAGSRLYIIEQGKGKTLTYDIKLN